MNYENNKVSQNLLNLDFRLPYNSKLTVRAKILRKNMTKFEKIIWYKILKNKKLKEFRFLRQRPIDNYIVDFYCPKLKLVLEIDGDIHLERIEYDEIRTKTLESYGLKVVRYSNQEISDDLDWVFGDLLKHIETCTQKNLKKKSP